MSNNLLIDLDSILDTRLPILTGIDRDIAKKVQSKGVYKNRVSDSFEYISHDVFREIYKSRTKRVLQTPLPTGIVNLITEYTLETKSRLIDYKRDDKLTVYVNIYPYRLNKEEIEIIKSRVHDIIPDFSSVEIVDKSIKEITIDFLIDNINVFIMYNGIEWLKYHMDIGELRRKSIPNILFIVPKLIGEIGRGSNEEYFKEMSKQTKPFIDLNFLPTKYFSCIL